MCLIKTPSMSMPAPQEPTRMQEAKAPEQASTARKRMAAAGGMASGTLLTGPSGVENNSLMLGKSTLLGQ